MSVALDLRDVLHQCNDQTSDAQLFDNVIPHLKVDTLSVYEAYLSQSERSYDFQAFRPTHRSTDDNRSEVARLWSHSVPDLSSFERLSLECTLIIRRASNYFNELTEVEKAVREFYGWDVFGNAFFNHPESQRFPAHIDGYHVLAWQLCGVKEWRIYHRQKQTLLKMELRTEPGDILFIPKGVPHSAIAVSPSFHLAIALMPTGNISKMPPA